MRLLVIVLVFFFQYGLGVITPQIPGNCTYFRLISVLNNSPHPKNHFPVTFKIPPEDLPNIQNANCRGIYVHDLGTGSQKKIWFENGQKCDSDIHFDVENILPLETKKFIFYYGCTHLNDSSYQQPNGEWISFVTTDQNDCTGSWFYFATAHNRFLKIDSSHYTSVGSPSHSHTYGNFKCQPHFGLFDAENDPSSPKSSSSSSSHDHEIFFDITSEVGHYPPYSVVPFCSSIGLNIRPNFHFFSSRIDICGYEEVNWSGMDRFLMGGLDFYGDFAGSVFHFHDIQGNTEVKSLTYEVDEHGFEMDADIITHDNHYHIFDGSTELASNYPNHAFFHILKVHNSSAIVHDDIFYLSTASSMPSRRWKQVHEYNSFFLYQSLSETFPMKMNMSAHNHNIDFPIGSAEGAFENIEYIWDYLGPNRVLKSHTHDLVGSTNNAHDSNDLPSFALTMWKRLPVDMEVEISFSNEGNVKDGFIGICYPYCDVNSYCVIHECVCNMGYIMNDNNVCTVDATLVLFIGGGIGGIVFIFCLIITFIFLIIIFIIIIKKIRIKKNKGIEKTDEELTSLEISNTTNENGDSKRRQSDVKSGKLFNQVKSIKSLKDLFNFKTLKRSSTGNRNDDSDHEKGGPKIIVHNDLAKIDPNEIKLIAELGSGGSGARIYKAEWNDIMCALKVFSAQNSISGTQSFEEFEKEASIIGSISHPCIIQHYGWLIEDRRVGILMEFCEFGDLTSFIMGKKEKGVKVTLKEKIKMALGVSDGMKYLHSKGIIHRDLKSVNVLVGAGGAVKIIDFGTAKLGTATQIKNKQTQHIGTSYYMAPEVVMGKYDHKCDVFSFAIVLFELFTENFRPYEGRDEVGMVEFKVATKKNFRPVIPRGGNIPDAIKDLMREGWKHNANERPSFEEISKRLRKLKKVK